MRNTYLPFGKPNFGPEEEAAVLRVLRSGWIGMGPETLKFEEELADHLQVPHVVTVSSCTAALFLSLLVSGVGQGDEVIVPSLTWCSTANAALYLGAKPVFCDLDPQTFCVTPQEILAKITPRTKAVIPVHYGGYPVDVEEIRKVLPREVVIVEDAAHAFGSRYFDGKRVGASGNLVCFSFYANKNLSTGEGGAIALFGQTEADRLRSLRQHGMPTHAWNRFVNPKGMVVPSICEVGYKMNYTDLQAALGRVQLARQPEFSQIRLGIAREYLSGLSEMGIQFQSGLDRSFHARHLIPVVFEEKHDRDAILGSLRERNIGASIHYAPLHRMPIYGHGDPLSLPQTDRIATKILTLPVSASMSPDDTRDVVRNVREVLGV
ncbi:MAG: DegT/DnrJ/EryC1/StrS family aminotransferase [Candidatus Riflebacteria bacterium]|nr:DegT/DnrJ/EryC1/StrS family aminotransferase [Candidatus Riflebacteria bacterium]